MRYFRSKELIHFELYPILSSLIKSQAILFFPTQGVTHPFVQHIRAVNITHWCLDEKLNNSRAELVLNDPSVIG